MQRHSRFWRLAVLGAALLATASVSAQITPADYERAAKVRERYQGLANNIPETANAVPNTHRFWYRKSVKGGNEFVLVDAAKVTREPAFDHEKLARSLSTASGGKYTALTLPFTTFRFVDNDRSIEFTAGGSTWRCDLGDYTCKVSNSPRPTQAICRLVGFGPQRASARTRPESQSTKYATNLIRKPSID